MRVFFALTILEGGTGDHFSMFMLWTFVELGLRGGDMRGFKCERDVRIRPQVSEQFTPQKFQKWAK